ncbi:MAG: outer membrane beta-barrel protein [Hyphomicrobiaceae bacterium]|nr:outer membrane beta-barrel protein [Hyphomicrobiaceae bacterium]
MAWLFAGVACISAVDGGGARAQDRRRDEPVAQVDAGLRGSQPEALALPADTLPALPLRRIEPDVADTGDPWEPRVAPSYGRPPVVDGDVSGVAPEPEAQDGVLVDAEPPRPVDGVDGAVDTRQEEEAAAFELPRAGDDQSAFSIPIEPDPTSDRRPARLFRFEPYDPLGIRVGTFVLYPEAEVGTAVFNNVFRSAAGARSDVALETRPALRAVSDWGVHALELSTRGLGSFHADNPSEDDRAWSAEARGRLDVTRRTRLEALASHDVSQETRGSINTRSGSGSRADISTDRADLSLTHRFNRLSVQLRGGVAERDQSPTIDVNGATVSNEDRDSTQRQAALRTGWELKPELVAFAELGIDDRSYKAVSASDGIARDSTGERYRAGVSFGATSRTLQGEASIGTARQRFDDGRLPAMRGVIVDANLAWRISGLTSLRLTAATDIGDSTVAGSGGAFSRTAGLEVRHALRRHLIATAGIRYARADYAGVDLVEEETTTSAAIEHYVNREVTLFARYAHVDFATTQPAANYGADEVRIGVRVRR